MKWTLSIIGATILTFILLSPASAHDCNAALKHQLLFAQAAPGEGDDFALAGRGERKHLEQLRMLKLLELLNLSEEQELPFLTAFQSMRREQRELDARRRELLEKLAEGIKSESLSDAEIDRSIDSLQELQKMHGDELRSFVKEARTILSAEQMAKMIIFHERFEYELLKKLRGFRDRMGRGGAPRGPGPHRHLNNEDR
jgi:Spy/CpxP family protein refolding chaperone